MFNWLVDYEVHFEAAADLTTIVALLGGSFYALWQFGVFRTFRANFEVEVKPTQWLGSNNLVTLTIVVSNEGVIPIVLPRHIGHRVRLTVVGTQVLQLSRDQGIGVVWDAAGPDQQFTEQLTFGGLPLELKPGQERTCAVSFYPPPEAVAGLVEVDVIGERSWGRSPAIQWSTSIVVNKEMNR